jgi:hypothetical protein
MIMSMSGFGDMDVAEYTNQVGDLAIPEVVKSNAKHEVVLGQQEVSEPWTDSRVMNEVQGEDGVFVQVETLSQVAGESGRGVSGKDLSTSVGIVLGDSQGNKEIM